MSQIFIENKPEASFLKSKAQDHKNNENILIMYLYMQEHEMFENNKVLMNAFTKQQATLQQKHDMLAFREIGLKMFKNYVTCRILDKPSSNVPVRKQKLLTLAPCKADSKRKINEKEKELKDVTKYLRRRLDWCRLTGETYDPNEQYSIYPQALCDSNGLPHSGAKSSWLPKLINRYTLNKCLPNGWIAETVIIDAMFLLNTRPLRRNTTIALHSSFLFYRFILPHYLTGSSEVHLIFVKPTRQRFHIKSFERKKRDNKMKNNAHHTCITFEPETTIYSKW